MNPFDWSGPPFLIFYTVLSAAVSIVLVLRRRSREDRLQPSSQRLNEPYLIAYLRAGKTEVTYCAVISLIDRRILTVDEDSWIRLAAGARLEDVTDPIESELLKVLGSASLRMSELQKIELSRVLSPYDRRLAHMGLMPDSAEKYQRWMDYAAAAILLFLVAAIKIAVAFGRGRTNILFLIFFAIAALLISLVLAHPRVTRRGQRMIEDLQSLLAGLRERASSLVPNVSNPELLLLSAVFGVAALPLSAFPEKVNLFRAAKKDKASGDSCGSSSCGSDGGSSCGGGCGGGCGGCGS